MKAGTIIRTKHNIMHIGPPQWEYMYFILKNGPFEIGNREGDVYKFKGKHFVCIGSTYFRTKEKSSVSNPCGFEILEDEYEIVTEIPTNLK